MEKTRTLVPCGASLSIAAIGTGLADKPGWRVIPVNSALPAAAQRLRQLHPDIVLFDLAAAQPDAAISLMKELPDLLLIGVDLANHQALVLSGEQPSLYTTDDFVRLIELHAVQAARGAGASP